MHDDSKVCVCVRACVRACVLCVRACVLCVRAFVEGRSSWLVAGCATSTSSQEPKQSDFDKELDEVRKGFRRFRAAAAEPPPGAWLK
jgi:hypothetical protein